MNLFDHIKNITQLKKRYILKISDDFSPYMIQRFVSFYIKDPKLFVEFNKLVNRQTWLFNYKQEFYDYLIAILPKLPYAAYIKSDKKSKKEEDKTELLKELGELLEVSVRELREYLEIDPTLLDAYEKTKDIYRRKN